MACRRYRVNEHTVHCSGGPHVLPEMKGVEGIVALNKYVMLCSREASLHLLRSHYCSVVASMRFLLICLALTSVALPSPLHVQDASLLDRGVSSNASVRSSESTFTMGIMAFNPAVGQMPKDWPLLSNNAARMPSARISKRRAGTASRVRSESVSRTLYASESTDGAETSSDLGDDEYTTSTELADGTVSPDEVIQTAQQGALAAIQLGVMLPQLPTMIGGLAGGKTAMLSLAGLASVVWAAVDVGKAVHEYLEHPDEYNAVIKEAYHQVEDKIEEKWDELEEKVEHKFEKAVGKIAGKLGVILHKRGIDSAAACEIAVWHRGDKLSAADQKKLEDTAAEASTLGDARNQKLLYHDQSVDPTIKYYGLKVCPRCIARFGLQC